MNFNHLTVDHKLVEANWLSNGENYEKDIYGAIKSLVSKEKIDMNISLNRTKHNNKILNIEQGNYSMKDFQKIKDSDYYNVNSFPIFPIKKGNLNREVKFEVENGLVQIKNSF